MSMTFQQALMIGVFHSIRLERERQLELWGDQWEPGNIDDGTKLAILMEEVGEVAKDVLEGRVPEEELIHVASVCVAWAEGIRWRRDLNDHEG